MSFVLLTMKANRLSVFVRLSSTRHTEIAKPQIVLHLFAKVLVFGVRKLFLNGFDNLGGHIHARPSIAIARLDRAQAPWDAVWEF
jgi:hypothetical protein